MRNPLEVNAIHQLADDAYVDTREAAAFLTLTYETLRWYRSRRPEASPKFCTIGGRSVRYRMGDLRAFLKGDPNAFQVPRSEVEG